MAKDNREDEPKFRVIDKRGGEDEEPEPEVSAQPEPEPPAEAPGKEQASPDMSKTEMSEEEQEKLQKEAEESFKFANTVFLLLRMISEQIWIHLGLIPNPVSRLTVKNLDEARKLIDLFGAILNHAESELDEPTLNELKRIHSDLMINYTNQLGR
jgi:hypothetical protein